MSADAIEALKRRKQIYEKKRDAKDVFEQDAFNHHDLYDFAVEAIDWAIADVETALNRPLGRQGQASQDQA